jgi:hypothetical protein
MVSSADQLCGGADEAVFFFDVAQRGGGLSSGKFTGRQAHGAIPARQQEKNSDTGSHGAPTLSVCESWHPKKKRKRKRKRKNSSANTTPFSP